MATQNNGNKSKLHDIINKDSTKMIIAISGAVFLVIFALFASRSLISQSIYQNKIISEKKIALKIIKNNVNEAKNLEASYISFATEQINIIGGSPDGNGPKDGDNAKLVLEALPDQFDYPALSSSIEKILLDGGYTIQSIGGDDSTARQSAAGTEAVVTTGNSAPEEIPYPFRVSTTPQSALILIKTLENSIRPFQVTSLKIEGGSNSLELSIGMKSFFQASSGLQVSEKVVK